MLVSGCTFDELSIPTLFYQCHRELDKNQDALLDVTQRTINDRDFPNISNVCHNELK